MESLNAPVTPLADMVRTLCDSLTDAARTLSVELVNNIHDPQVMLPGEHAVIQKALSLLLRSLIENSLPNNQIEIEHTHSPTTLDVIFRVTPNPMFILLTKRLFDPLDQQLSVETIKSSPDSYISLLLARKLAQQQRVKIWLHTENNTTCSLHCLFITKKIQPNPNRERPLILVIEDNKHIRKLMELYLRQAGFETIGANDGDEGLQMVNEHIPDLITLDVMMPSKDGWQVLAALKENPKTNFIPVIVVSVMKDTQIGYELGASDYLTKPVDHDELVSSVRRLTDPLLTAPITTPRALKKIAVIDPSMRLIDTIMNAFTASELMFLETNIVSMFEALQNAIPDAILVVLEERERERLLPLLCRLRLYSKLNETPFYAVMYGEGTEDQYGEFQGIIHRFINSQQISSDSFA